MSFKEWAFGPSAEQRKKIELEARLQSLEAWLGNVTMSRSTGAEQRDARDPEDARIIDRLQGQIEDVKRELAELQGTKI